jgi:hypothetical protein
MVFDVMTWGVPDANKLYLERSFQGYILWDDILLFGFSDKFGCLRFCESAVSMLWSMYGTHFGEQCDSQHIVCAPEPACASVVSRIDRGLIYIAANRPHLPHQCSERAALHGNDDGAFTGRI